jgi:hypothetical protein
VLQIDDEVKVLIKDVDIDLETVSLDRWALNPGVPVLVRIIDTDTVVERIGLHMRHLPEDDIANWVLEAWRKGWTKTRPCSTKNKVTAKTMNRRGSKREITQTTTWIQWNMMTTIPVMARTIAAMK